VRGGPIGGVIWHVDGCGVDGEATPRFWTLGWRVPSNPIVDDTDFTYALDTFDACLGDVAVERPGEASQSVGFRCWVFIDFVFAIYFFTRCKLNSFLHQKSTPYTLHLYRCLFVRCAAWRSVQNC
jgi:hypothetical protein